MDINIDAMVLKIISKSGINEPRKIAGVNWFLNRINLLSLKAIRG